MEMASRVVGFEGQSIRVYRSNTDGEILDPEVYPITGENPFNLLVEDFTADGRPDLLYLNNDGKQSAALRQQLEDGSFGPELRQAMDRPARTLHAMSAVGNTRAQLVSVDSRSGFLEFLELTQNGSPEGVEVIRPEVYPFSVKGGEGVRYAFGDFDKDDDFDVVIADSAKAEVMLFSYAEGRFGTSVSFPSFSTISSLAAGRFFILLESTDRAEQRREDIGTQSFERIRPFGFSGQHWGGSGRTPCCRNLGF